MKILYTSVFQDGTGYAHAALENALAFEAAGLDVVCRAISLSPRKGTEAARRIAHLSQKDLQSIDVVVQHSLPHTFEYKGGVRNIGVFAWETTHFRRSDWASSCNMMDEVWVFCLQSRQAALDSGVRVPVRVIPHACDPNRFTKRPEPLDIPPLRGRTVLYAIGEYTRRKNFAGLFRAYLAAFSRRDDVALLVKTTIPGMRPDQAERHLAGMVEEIKQSIHVYPDPKMYPPIVTITSYLSPLAIDRLHATGHVFVLPSHAESWCLPAMDAMGFGNPVIVPNWGSFPDLTYAQAPDYFSASTQQFVHPGQIDTGYLIPGQLTPCFAPDSGFPNLYTGDERWFEPNLDALIDLMRCAHAARQRGETQPMGVAAANRVLRFSHARVGQVIRGALEG